MSDVIASLPKIRKSETFRDSIPTYDAAGKRRWMYPRKPPTGQRRTTGTVNWYRLRSGVAWVLLAIMFVGPFVRINGNPLLMFNIVERKFSLFGTMFFPQDLYLFALTMITAFVMIVLFTAVFGRVFCGWACPQTVLMEMVFRKIEYLIEGDRRQQQRLDALPWNREKILKKGFKLGLFFALSFVIGNWLLMYVIGSEAWVTLVTDHPRDHVGGLTAMLAFTALFFGLFARFREQACTFVCPYGRFQSVMLDENTMVVAYDHKRGEPKARASRFPDPTRSPVGDCVDCSLCVEVCPTGIDIRNGTQMECVNCTNCIDACNSVMTRIGRDPGLIRFASLNNIENRETFRLTPRLMAYCGILLLLGVLLVFLLSFRNPIETTVIRAPGTIHQVQDDGRISNVYKFTVVNKTNAAKTLDIRIQDTRGEVRLPGGALIVERAGTAQSVFMIVLPPDMLVGGNQRIALELLEDGTVIETLDVGFSSPKNLQGNTP